MLEEQTKEIDCLIVDEQKQCAIALKHNAEKDGLLPYVLKREAGKNAKALFASAKRNNIPIVKDSSLAHGIYDDTYIGFALPEKYLCEKTLQHIQHYIDVVIINKAVTSAVALRYDREAKDAHDFYEEEA